MRASHLREESYRLLGCAGYSKWCISSEGSRTCQNSCQLSTSCCLYKKEDCSDFARYAIAIVWMGQVTVTDADAKKQLLQAVQELAITGKMLSNASKSLDSSDDSRRGLNRAAAALISKAEAVLTFTPVKGGAASKQLVDVAQEVGSSTQKLVTVLKTVVTNPNAPESKRNLGKSTCECFT